ncbi:hypothetical protein [Streptomyces sp. NPDC059761]|uniref:hypothetical protein n=1 Tax=Streptomyces sp. NPDC059761 TaxID=3346937 RepID=UPI003657D24D
MSKFTDDMRTAFGVVNAVEVSKRYDCPVIYYRTKHPHAQGYTDYRSEIVYPREGEFYRKVFRPRDLYDTPQARRAGFVKTAQDWAAERLGASEWVASGYLNTWMPKGAHERMTAELKAWRKAQKEASK